MTNGQTHPYPTGANLLLPTQPPRAFAIYAFRARPSTDPQPASAIPSVFAAARHPKSFIALDGIDHAINEPHQARHVAGLIAAWAQPYLADHTPTPPLDHAGHVVVTDAGKYAQQITAGRHLLTADEPVS